MSVQRHALWAALAVAVLTRPASAQFIPQPPETPVPFTRLDASTLRIPLLGFARVTNEAQWRTLWERYDVGDSTRRRRPVPTVDFSRDELLVVAAYGTKCARDNLVNRLFNRRDTIHVVAAWPMTRGAPCPASPGTADALRIRRTRLPIRPVYNAMYATVLSENPWSEHRTISDLDKILDRENHAGWLEMLVREDSSVVNLRRLVLMVRGYDEANYLFSSRRVRGDARALAALIGRAGVSINGGLDTLALRHGMTLARDAETPRATLDLLLQWVREHHEPHPIAAAILANPSVGDDAPFRGDLAASGLLPGGAIAGTVRDSTGKPRGDVTVVMPGIGREATTGPDGSFRVLGVRPGRVRVIAYLTPVDSLAATVTVADRDTVQWNPVIADHYSTRQRPKLARYPGDDVDSAGRRLLKGDTTRVANFRAFSRRFVTVAMEKHPAAENLVISPFSAALALALASEGARGATATAILGTLGIHNWSAAERLRRITETRRQFEGRRDVELSLSSAVWADVGVAVAPEFRRTAETSYRALVRSMPLATTAAAAAVNHWADSVTFGRIKTIQSGPFDALTRIFLANAVYFNGAWLDKFDATSTRPRPFAVGGGGAQRVATMEQTREFGYVRGPGYQIARLPYRAGKTAMYVVLPDRGVTRGQLLAALAAAWPSTAAFSPTLLHLQLPRMHVEQSVDLPAILEAVGLGIAFDAAHADFSGLGRITRGPGNLAIGEATQKVFLDVNEEGTEAAAVTSMEMVVTSLPRVTPFIVDRPFLFILRDESTGADLFVGWIARP